MVKNGQESNVHTFPEVGFARREWSAFGVEVLDLQELHSRKNLEHSIFRVHRIEFHILFLVTRGRGWHMVDFVRHSAERGALIHIAPGQVQRYDSENELAGFLVLFQPEVCAVEAPHTRWPPLLRPIAADFELLESLVQMMFDLKTREVSASPARLAWRIFSAVHELCEAAAARHLVQEGKPRSEVFQAFDSLLNENLARHRELSWYARRLGYSEKSLSRRSRQLVGLNAKAYIDRRVTLEAKRLLVHTEHSVESIAARLGFSESTNFVKFFKRIEGETPSNFRRSYDAP